MSQISLLTQNKNVLQYAVLVVVLIALWLWFRTLNYTPTHPMHLQAVSLPGLVVAIVVGALGISGLKELNLPAIWDERASLFQKLLLPVLIGLAFGVWGILNSRLSGNAGGGSSTAAPFPASVPLYVLGNAQTEIFFRMGLLILFTSLGRKWFPDVAWLPIAVMALVEVATAFMGFFAGGGKMSVLNALLSILFFGALSVAQSAQFMQVGFIAPVLTRIALGVIGEILVPLMNR
jgi:hypothetical protein